MSPLHEFNSNELDNLINWETVNLEDPAIDTCHRNISADIVMLEESLLHLNSGTSSLPYNELEEFKEKLEDGIMDSKIMLALLEKVIAVRNVTRITQ